MIESVIEGLNGKFIVHWRTPEGFKQKTELFKFISLCSKTDNEELAVDVLKRVSFLNRQNEKNTEEIENEAE